MEHYCGEYTATYAVEKR